LVGEALESEVRELLSGSAGRRNELGRAAMVRNGYQPERAIQTGVGPVTVKVPKVRSRDGNPVSFRSALVPPYARTSASLEAALPWLYLKDISTGEMQPALEVLVGREAKSLSASTVSRLKQQWREDYEGRRYRRVDRDRWLYISADGNDSGLRAERQRLCALVIVAVNERGEKHFLAIEDGIRESTQSWREVLLGLKSHGLKAPELAVGDRPLDFWAALEGVFPVTRAQRVLDAQSRQRGQCSAERCSAESQIGATRNLAGSDPQDPEWAFEQVIVTYEAKCPKATACLLKDGGSLMTFHDLPVVHRQHYRTTNPMESTYATTRHCTTRCVMRDTMRHMMFKRWPLCRNWRKLRSLAYLQRSLQV
jgi:putative transposase